MPSMLRISPCLWFDDQAEEAAKYYTSIFRNSRIVRTALFGEEGHEIHGRPAGSVLTVDFELEGQPFTALNGGPVFTFNEALSLQVFCDSQEELDDYWDKLSAGGPKDAQQCGWLKDRYGVSWQIVPSMVSEMMTDPDYARRERVMAAILKMKKIDIAELLRAAEG